MIYQKTCVSCGCQFESNYFGAVTCTKCYGKKKREEEGLLRATIQHQQMEIMRLTMEIAKLKVTPPSSSTKSSMFSVPQGDKTLKLSTDDLRRFRSFVHPDKHRGNPDLEEKAHYLSTLLNKLDT